MNPLYLKGEELAKGACPGEWEVRCRELDNHEQYKVWAGKYGWLVTRGDLPRAYHDPSMEHIAHHSGEYMLALYARLRKLEEAIQFAVAQYTPGVTKQILIEALSEGQK